jgi:hypothetical protein
MHAGACAVGEDEKVARVGRNFKEGGDFVVVVNFETRWYCGGHASEILAEVADIEVKGDEVSAGNAESVDGT